MTIPDFVVRLSEWLVGLGAGVAAVAWLVRALFQQLLSKDLEVFRADLQRSAVEHQARFSSLHDRRVEAIDGLYRRLIRAQHAFLGVSGGILGEDESYDDRLRAAGEAGQELLQYFSENRLYYDAEIVTGFGAINKVLSSAWGTFVLERRDNADYPIPVHERERFVKVWKEARKGVMETVPKLVDELESKMRVILGAANRTVLAPPPARKADREE